MSDETVIFLLVGKTGVGKSALGNSILGQDVFESTNSPDSVTKEILVNSTERTNFHITVVDTPGLMATKLKTEESKVQACKDMKKAMRTCPCNGKLAVIYVIKYGERFTEENKNTLYILENIFGKKNVWKSCIIVMTYGDNFDSDYQNKPFLDYLKEISGEFGELFKKCKCLCVLFRNKTKSVEEKRKQFELLMNCVRHLDQGYTHNKFQEAIKGQNRIEQEPKLPTLKEEFLPIIEHLPGNIFDIKFNAQSSEALDAVEQFIHKNLSSVNEMDTPELIYYKANEQGLLEDIRSSFKKMLHLIEKKREDFRQMKVAQDFQNTIDETKTGISNTDPNHKDILSLINGFGENIKETNKQIKSASMRNEFSDSLNKSIESSRQEISGLKQRAQQAKEFEINKKKEDINQRLKNVDTHDNDATEHLRNLKKEIDTLKGSLEKEHRLIHKHFIEIIKYSLTQILREIKDKEEKVRQFKLSETLNKKIEKLEHGIINTKPTHEDVYRFISDVDQTLKSLEKSVKKENLCKEFKDHLKLSITRAQKHLQNLKHQVQERKETEIETLLKSITKMVQNTDCQDKETFTILSQARRDHKSLLSKLNQERNKITDDCFITCTTELNQIEKEIEIKEQTAENLIRTEQLIIKINDVTNEIDQINPRDINITEIISKLQSQVLKLQKETQESNVGEQFLKRLNEAVQTAEKSILNAISLIEKIKKEKIESEIEEIKEQIYKLDVTSGACEQATKQIEAHLSELKSKIEQEELNEDVKEYLMLTVKTMHIDINFKNDDASQRTIARNIMKEIQIIMIGISEISITQENIFAKFTNFEVEVCTSKKKIIEAELSDAIKHDLFSALESAEKILDKRKQETVKNIELDLNSISNSIKEANPDDVNITMALSIIKEKLVQLKRRMGEHFKEEYENNFTKLTLRVGLFNEIKAAIDSFISRIKILGIPCKPSHFDDFRVEVNEIKKNLLEKIKDTNDFNILSERIDRCVAAIKCRSSNNKKKLVGRGIRYFPILGPIIEDAITAGIDNDEINQLISL